MFLVSLNLRSFGSILEDASDGQFGKEKLWRKPLWSERVRSTNDYNLQIYDNTLSWE